MVDLPRPPLWLQGGTYAAGDDSILLRALLASPSSPTATGGIIGSTDLKVTQKATPNMSVDVAGGIALVNGLSNASYLLEVPAGLTNVTIAAADPTNPRKDIVIARVYDASFSGVLNKATLEVVTGTPAGSPVAPATPAGATLLAQVLVGAGVTSILTANITDKRLRALSRVRHVTSDGDPDPSFIVGTTLAQAADALQVTDAGGTPVFTVGPDGNITKSPKLTGAWTAYTPVWTAVTTNPTLGNATLTGRFRQIGKTVDFQIMLTFGSTSVGGAGPWKFSLPVAALATSGLTCSCRLFDTSAGNNQSGGGFTDSTETGTVRALFATGSVTTAAPWTWATGDVLMISGTYEAA